MNTNHKKQTVIEAVPAGMCTGCSACINSCPRKALYFATDRFGYFVPKIDSNRCDRCGLCGRVCPAINLPNKQNSHAPVLFAFIAKNAKLLQKSSSGGAFGVLAEHILSQGGVVSGCSWSKNWPLSIFKDADGHKNEIESVGNAADTDSDPAFSSDSVLHIAEHVIIDDKKDLSCLHKSKYFQSFMGNTFSEIEDLLKQSKIVLFTGCPCQVAGLKSFLKKDYDGLICVDLLCGNAPSQAFFIKYVKESFPEVPVSYEFRNKTVGKWNSHTVKVCFKNGKVLAIPKSSDYYQMVYHPHIMIPPHCIHCKYQALPRYGDLTIGDLWGISKHDPYLDYKQGLSVVLVNNNKGKRFLESVSKDQIRVLEEKPLDWLGGNGSALKGTHNWSSPGTPVFYSLINKKSFRETVEAALAVNRGKNLIHLSGRRCINVSGAEISFNYNPKSWEQHFIHGAIFLFSKNSSAPDYACLDLDDKIVQGNEYVLCVKFRIATDSENVEFFLLNKKKKRDQLVLTHHVISTDRVKTVELCVKFFSKDVYDSFMLKNSQVSGNLAFISFEEIAIIEYQCNPYVINLSVDRKLPWYRHLVFFVNKVFH